MTILLTDRTSVEEFDAGIAAKLVHGLCAMVGCEPRRGSEAFKQLGVETTFFLALLAEARDLTEIAGVARSIGQHGISCKMIEFYLTFVADLRDAWSPGQRLALASFACELEDGLRADLVEFAVDKAAVVTWFSPETRDRLIYPVCTQAGAIKTIAEIVEHQACVKADRQSCCGPAPVGDGQSAAPGLGDVVAQAVEGPGPKWAKRMIRRFPTVTGFSHRIDEQKSLLREFNSPPFDQSSAVTKPSERHFLGAAILLVPVAWYFGAIPGVVAEELGCWTGP